MSRELKGSDSASISPNILRVLLAFRTAGWFGFWSQLVLAIISSLILLFALISYSAATGPNNPGTGPGIIFALLGLVTLYFSIYWSYRYTLTAKKLRASSTKDRPSKADSIKQLKIGTIVSLVGMLLTLLGAGAIVGVLVAKSLSQPQTALVVADMSSRTVQPLDIFVVQANTNTILAHFLGICTSLWLLNRIADKSDRPE